MITGYLGAATAAQWKDEIKPNLFATRKQLGNVQTITFHRDADDGSDVAVGPFEVLVVVSTGGAPQVGADQSTAFVGVSGEFQSDDPDFSVARGDRFCLDAGACGVITTAPIADVAFTRVPFQIER